MYDSNRIGTDPDAEEHGSNGGINKMSELERLLKACVGAVETVAEKTGDMIDILAEKGTPAYEEAVKKGSKVLETIRTAMKNEKVCSDMDELTERIRELSRDQLEILKSRISEAEASLDREIEERKQGAKEQMAEAVSASDENSVENPEDNEDGEPE